MQKLLKQKVKKFLHKRRGRETVRFPVVEILKPQGFKEFNVTIEAS